MIEQLRRTQAIQRDCIPVWEHAGEFAAEGEFERRIVALHHRNYLLWKQEDLCREPGATDAGIAAAKRAIDKLNMRRHEAIEALDDLICAWLVEQGRGLDFDAPLHSESPAAIIDRSSILALRIFHYRQPATASVAEPDTADRLEFMERQFADLGGALIDLLHEVRTGTRRYTLYRHLKRYGRR